MSKQMTVAAVDSKIGQILDAYGDQGEETIHSHTVTRVGKQWHVTFRLDGDEEFGLVLPPESVENDENLSLILAWVLRGMFRPRIGHKELDNE